MPGNVLDIRDEVVKTDKRFLPSLSLFLVESGRVGGWEVGRRD